jgi:HK97 gp10 family phage protein
MTVRYVFDLKGLSEYLEKIVQAGEDVDEAAARAVTAGGDVLVQGMQGRVAVLTGNLKEHISRTEPVRDGNYTYIDVGVLDGENLADADTARYGNAQEFGTASMPAHPYIRPAIDEDKSKVRAAERAALEQDGIL